MSRRGRSVLTEALLADAMEAAREAAARAHLEEDRSLSSSEPRASGHRWPIYRCGLHPLGGPETCAVGPSSGRCRHGLCPGASSFLPISARSPEEPRPAGDPRPTPDPVRAARRGR